MANYLLLNTSRHDTENKINSIAAGLKRWGASSSFYFKIHLAETLMSIGLFLEAEKHLRAAGGYANEMDSDSEQNPRLRLDINRMRVLNGSLKNSVEFQKGFGGRMSRWDRLNQRVALFQTMLSKVPSRSARKVLALGPSSLPEDDKLAIASTKDWDVVAFRAAPGQLMPSTPVTAATSYVLVNHHATSNGEFNKDVLESMSLGPGNRVLLTYDAFSQDIHQSRIDTSRGLFATGGPNIMVDGVFHLVMSGDHPNLYGIDFYAKESTYEGDKAPAWFGVQHLPDGSNRRPFKMSSDLATHNPFANRWLIRILRDWGGISTSRAIDDVLDLSDREYAKILQRKYGDKRL